MTIFVQKGTQPGLPDQTTLQAMSEEDQVNRNCDMLESDCVVLHLNLTKKSVVALQVSLKLDFYEYFLVEFDVP